jgi:hypothetical protein
VSYVERQLHHVVHSTVLCVYEEEDTCVCVWRGGYMCHMLKGSFTTQSTILSSVKH